MNLIGVVLTGEAGVDLMGVAGCSTAQVEDALMLEANLFRISLRLEKSLKISLSSCSSYLLVLVGLSSSLYYLNVNDACFIDSFCCSSELRIF